VVPACLRGRHRSGIAADARSSSAVQTERRGSRKTDFRRGSSIDRRGKPTDRRPPKAREPSGRPKPARARARTTARLPCTRRAMDRRLRVDARSPSSTSCGRKCAGQHRARSAASSGASGVSRSRANPERAVTSRACTWQSRRGGRCTDCGAQLRRQAHRSSHGSWHRAWGFRRASAVEEDADQMHPTWRGVWGAVSPKACRGRPGGGDQRQGGRVYHLPFPEGRRERRSLSIAFRRRDVIRCTRSTRSQKRPLGGFRELRTRSPQSQPHNRVLRLSGGPALVIGRPRSSL